MRLIPSFIEDNSPPGERLLFSAFERSEKEWIVLHSLDLAPYNNNRRTEIDFIIIMPEKGIVCIEVKSQKDIAFVGDKWQPPSIKRSPFKQAMDARYALHRRLKDKFGERLAHIPVMHLCIFPRSDFNLHHNASISSFEVIDQADFRACVNKNSLAEKISEKFTRAIDADPQVTRLSNPLKEIDINNIVDFCYPIRKRKPELAAEIKAKQIELENTLLVQQKPIIQLSQLNNRVIVEGGAGTGKTLIGLEVARRKALDGKRVAFLCFNNLIGRACEAILRKCELPNLLVGSVYRVLLDISGISIPQNARADWWNFESISLIEEKLTDPGFKAEVYFDYLVIDEAQDILARPDLWNCLQNFLKTGLEKSKFLLLGDFVNQSLNDNVDEMNRELRRIKGFSTSWIIDQNCRNYKQIGQLALTLSASEKSTWSGFMRTGGGLDKWQLEAYSDNSKQAELISNAITKAEQAGFQKRDITILTFGSLQKSVIELLKSKVDVSPVSVDNNLNKITYATINSYKGMENKVIIITDVVIAAKYLETERKVFYTGMTRATEQLVVFCKKTVIPTLMKWVQQG